MNEEVRKAMLELARRMRSAATWTCDDYYMSEADAAKNAAKRDVYEEIASSIDSVFDVDSTIKEASDELSR